jgi:hypothetical protein
VAYQGTSLWFVCRNRQRRREKRFITSAQIARRRRKRVAETAGERHVRPELGVYQFLGTAATPMKIKTGSTFSTPHFLFNLQTCPISQSVCD